ncbi:MAG: hypothetical protein ACK56F_20980, partial [bacterium]
HPACARPGLGGGVACRVQPGVRMHGIVGAGERVLSLRPVPGGRDGQDRAGRPMAALVPLLLRPHRVVGVRGRCGPRDRAAAGGRGRRARGRARRPRRTGRAHPGRGLGRARRRGGR